MNVEDEDISDENLIIYMGLCTNQLKEWTKKTNASVKITDICWQIFMSMSKRKLTNAR